MHRMSNLNKFNDYYQVLEKKSRTLFHEEKKVQEFIWNV